MWKKYLPFIPPVVIYSLIIYLSSQPASSLPDLAPDIFPHFIEYFLLAFFLSRAFDRRTNKKFIIICLWVLFFLTLLDECYQYFVPTRYFQLKDIVFDLLGGVSGSFVYLFYKGKLRRQKYDQGVNSQKVED